MHYPVSNGVLNHPATARVASASGYFVAMLCGLFIGLAGHCETPNALPLRIGADQNGQNAFRGEIAALRLYDRPLKASEITNLASAHPNARAVLPGLVAQWIFGGQGDGLLANDPKLPARPTGTVTREGTGNAAGSHFGGGYFTVAGDPRPGFTSGTVEA